MNALIYVVGGLFAWFAIRTVSPKTAGLILAALVIGVLVKVFAAK